MKGFIKISLIFFIVIFLLSCATKTLKLKDKEDAFYIMEKLKLYNDNVKTFDGNAIIFRRDSKRSSSFKAKVIASRETNGLKIDINDFVFNKPLVSIIKNNSEVLVISYIKKEFYSSNYDDFDFRKMTGFDIPKELFTDAILGKVYIINGIIKTSSDNNKSLYVKNDNIAEEIYLNSEFLPSKIFYFTEDGLYEVIFNKYIMINNLMFPAKITIKKKDDMILEINYREANLNNMFKKEALLIDMSILNSYRKVE